ncbi:family 10 glycosylhydrolase [Pedobacter sp. UBA4863]|uniref:glycoside hydrolase family 10 protein n=1 Tax=Pedobacter sp. UBA4863 TaxID=1947060 RepID=UPI0025F070D1|nr:family 10 glycosylhydrolase [Pedobacter sp. UBA4863]
MKKYPLYLVLALALILNACKKSGSGGGGTTPPVTNPPTTPTGLTYPKKEARAVWITTVWGLDWPGTVYGEAAQKQQYINYLNKFKELNINVIYFQVKGMSDAFYDSPYEPWSKFITGVRGQKPSYDVLKFLIDEAHARDIEFHAWMNPYRVATDFSQTLPNGVDASWLLDYPSIPIRIYNPAQPRVRERLANIVKDLITKYDVDGIHFDDYFYPSSTTHPDAADYATYGAGQTSIQNFRRDNVNKAIKAVHDVIVATKPEIVFSVSPAPNKDYNYNTLFADIVTWCREGWVDVIIPQLYQETTNTGSNAFISNLNFWSANSYKAALMVGHALYKFGDPEQYGTGSTAVAAFSSTNELQLQFDLTKANAKVVGNVQYRALSITSNKIGITDKLKSIYSNLAVMPFVGRAVAPAPAVATNVRFEGGELKWNTSGDVKSVVYYFSDLKKEGKVHAIIKGNTISTNTKGYYVVSTLNVDNQESKPTDMVEKK